MIVFRLAKSEYISDLSGRGAEKSGGRWNSIGMPIVYTSESRALCTAEIAVHTGLGNMPVGYILATLEIPDNAITIHVDYNKLDADWRSFPHAHSTQEIGDRFIRDNEALILKVPSVVVPGDYNYLINPNHKDIRGIKIIDKVPFVFDERLFSRI